VNRVHVAGDCGEEHARPGGHGDMAAKTTSGNGGGEREDGRSAKHGGDVGWKLTRRRKGTNPVRLGCNMPGSEQKAAVEEVRDLEDGGDRRSRGGDVGGWCKPSGERASGKPSRSAGDAGSRTFHEDESPGEAGCEATTETHAGRIGGCASVGEDGVEGSDR
jgi:hypothetical protein